MIYAANTTNEKNIVVNSSNYPIDSCRVGVVHLGVGAFHRAHQAAYFDRYMQESGNLNWAIAGVNLRKGSLPELENLKKNAGCYILKTSSADHKISYQKIRSLVELYDWSTQTEESLSVCARKSVEIISITITESGYSIGANGQLNFKDPVIDSELNHGEKISIYAFLTDALKLRKQKINQPVTILSCDNIRGNGTLLKQNFYTYLTAFKEEKLLDWVKENVTFPNSVVDRITPRPSKELNQRVNKALGTTNISVVLAEEFAQWVIEDNFRGKKPQLELVGVQIVKDVHLFEQAKIRMLNGGHSALVYLGILKGYDYFNEVIADSECELFFNHFILNEVIPALRSNNNFEGMIDLEQYHQSLKMRFSNSSISDLNSRIAMDGYTKFAIFIMPTLLECFKNKIEPTYSIKAVASWYLYMKKNVILNESIYHDPYWYKLKPIVEKNNINKFIKHKNLWGDLPVIYPQFISLLKDEIKQLEKRFL